MAMPNVNSMFFTQDCLRAFSDPDTESSVWPLPCFPESVPITILARHFTKSTWWGIPPAHQVRVLADQWSQPTTHWFAQPSFRIRPVPASSCLLIPCYILGLCWFFLIFHPVSWSTQGSVLGLLLLTWPLVTSSFHVICVLALPPSSSLGSSSL